jgi:hypothetical protein
MYVKRARLSMPVQELPALQHENAVEELRDLIRSTLIEMNYGEEDDLLEDLDEEIEARPLVLILPLNAPEGSIVEEATADVPHLTLFFRAGVEGQAALAKVGLGYAAYLEPELVPDLEKKALREYRRAHRWLTGKREQGGDSDLQEAV